MRLTVMCCLLLGLFAAGGGGESAAGQTGPADGGAPSGGEKGEDRRQKSRKPRFTIGKETTYVTGPRDKEGYVDYPSALNERLGRGVTPATNATVALWQTFGPQPEGAPMPPTFFKWLGIPEPPKKGDYLVDFVTYMKKHQEVDPGKNLQDFLADHDAASTRPWATNQYPHVAGWLTVNEKPLNRVVEGTKRPHYFSPLVAKGDEKGPGPLIAALLPGVQECRELAHALITRAMWHLGEGRPDEAWQDLLACHRLARHVGRGVTLIEGLVGIAIGHIASAADLVYLDRAKADAKRLRACLRDLQSLPPMAPPADKIDLGERFIFLDTVMTLERQGSDALKGVFGPPLGGLIPDVPVPLAEAVLKDLDWDPALRAGNRWYDRLAAAMRVKDRAERAKQLNQIDGEVKALKKKLTDPVNLAKLAAGKESSEARGRVIGDVLIAQLVPAVLKVQTAADRGEQTQRNLHLAFALAAYRAEQGRYPKALDALAPKYVAQVPPDLFSGKALIYRPAKNGYLLYSVGVNGKDEGGRWLNEDPRGDDLNVRMPLPEPNRN